MSSASIGGAGAAPLGFETICVATDFNEPARLALDYGVTLAERFGADLHLLHVLHELGPGIADPNYTACFEMARQYFNRLLDTEEKGEQEGEHEAKKFIQCLEARTRERLEALVAELPSEHRRIETAIRYGKPVEEICAYAKMHHVDLLLLGTQGRTGTDYFLIGSVAERVVRVSPCPVMTVRLPRHA